MNIYHNRRPSNYSSPLRRSYHRQPIYESDIFDDNEESIRSTLSRRTPSLNRVTSSSSTVLDNVEKIKTTVSKLGYKWTEISNTAGVVSGRIKIGTVTVFVKLSERLQSVKVVFSCDNEITDLEEDTTELSNFTVDLQTSEIVIKSIQDKLP